MIEQDRAWQDWAACAGVDPELFYPGRGGSTREAKEVCRGCVVREACLEYALATSEKFGIWGGTSERERRRIRRQRGRVTAIQVAAESGVSTDQVRQAYREPHLVSQQRREAILAAAQRLGYQRKTTRQASATGAVTVDGGRVA